MILERKNMKRSSNLGEFLRYTILNILGMAGLSCYILADTFLLLQEQAPMVWLL